MLWSILGIGIGAFLIWERHDMIKAIIHSDVRFARATDITIDLDSLDVERQTVTYYVEYTDRDGIQCANRCVVDVAPWKEKAVHWVRPLDSGTER